MFPTPLTSSGPWEESKTLLMWAQRNTYPEYSPQLGQRIQIHLFFSFFISVEHHSYGRMKFGFHFVFCLFFFFKADVPQLIILPGKALVK